MNCGPLLLLAIAFIGLALTFGLLKRGPALKSLVFVVLIALLAPFLAGLFQSIFASLPPVQRIVLAIVLLGVTIFLGLRTLLGREVFGTVMGNFVYDFLRVIALFPFRLIGNIFRAHK